MCLHTWVCVCVDSSDGCRNTHAWATVGCRGNQPLSKEATERTEEVKDTVEVTEGETEGETEGGWEGIWGWERGGGGRGGCLLRLTCSVAQVNVQQLDSSQ